MGRPWRFSSSEGGGRTQAQDKCFVPLAAEHVEWEGAQGPALKGLAVF